MARIKLTTLMLCGCFAISFSAAAQERSSHEIVEVPFNHVHFADQFWKQKIEINRMVSIPSAFKECEKNGRFDNFALAAGLIKGEHRGDFSFDDTDPYKVIEGASYSLASKYDAQLDHYLDSVINIIALAQEPDGYLTTCVTNKATRLSGWWGTKRWDKINSHELYNCGHMYEAAVAHYKATGKRTFLDVAIKNADLICKVFGPNEGQIHRPSGHPIVEMALCKLYKVTGTQRYLDLAHYFVEETGRCTDGHRPSEYSQDHKPILQQDEIVGHAVRAGYLYSGVADVVALTGDKPYFEALTRIWDNMASRKLYITGGMGSRAQGEGFGPDYELKNHTAYCETCASIANVYWNYRMFLATGDAKYMDVAERALYNGVISGVSLTGDKFFYDNPLESLGEHQRQRWFGCACCPGNITRFMASVPGYVYATRGTEVFVNLYVQGSAEVQIGKKKLVLEQTTGYPWDGAVTIAVNPKRKTEFALRLRIPGWVKGQPVPTDLYSFANSSNAVVKATLNGEPISATCDDQGYLTINRKWKKGDKVTLDLPMEVQKVKANDKVEADRGRVALERGPMMYCLEGIDLKDQTVFNKYLSSDANFTTDTWAWDSYGPMTVLKGQAQEVDRSGAEKAVEVTAIPYFAWNNRGTENYQMEVWIPTDKSLAKATPEPTIASKAQTFAMSVPIQNDATIQPRMDWASGVNDQWEPASSGDQSKPYFYWWLKNGTEESLIYQFDKPYTVSKTAVYWLDFDHYDGNFRVPESWKLFYKDAATNTWKPVVPQSLYMTAKDCWNRLEFEPVTTQSLRLQAKLQKGVSGGVIEWTVDE
ncbi:MAG: glycoside hydrolase family 127 protein [Bacteroidaceae bacterium]|nr:glycoside hydrolase family 127 protein [Bacteroidaceae bacterium]